MLNNADIALLSKLNDLLERHGVNPCDIVATLKTNDRGQTVLSIESPPDNSKSLKSVCQVMNDIGMSPDCNQLVDSDSAIFAKLQSAIRLAPTHRRR